MKAFRDSVGLALVFLVLAAPLALRAAQPDDGPKRFGRDPDSVGPHHRTWNPVPGPDGQATGRPIVELGTGMNYFDRDRGEYRPSQAFFELGPNRDCFVAERVQHRVRLNTDINVVGAFQVRMDAEGREGQGDGLMLDSTPVAIALYDPQSGALALAAVITNSTAILWSSNQVIYPDCFASSGGNVCASIIVTIEQGTFAQDVLFTGKLDPTQFVDPITGVPFSTNCQIQIITEFYNSPPQPDRIRRPLYIEPDPEVRRRSVSPDLVDEVLGFDRFVLGAGYAYTIPTATEPAGGRAAVAKQFKTVGDDANRRYFLIETLPYASLAPQFMALPECNPAGGHARLSRPGGARVDYAAIPRPPAAAATLSTLNAPRSNIAFTLNAQRSTSASLPPGVLVDYIANIGGSQSSTYTLYASTNYLVSSNLVCNGTLIVEPTVIKYNVGKSITVNNTLTCKNIGQFRPAVFTAVDDDTIGSSCVGLAGYTNGVINANGYASPALKLGGTSLSITNFRFCYAQKAIQYYASAGATATISLNHCQLVKCIRGIQLDWSGCGGGGSCGTTLNVNNTLMAEVKNPVTINGVNTPVNLTLLHCTIDHADRVLDGGGGTGTVTPLSINSVYSYVTNNSNWTLTGDHNGFCQATNFGGSYYTFPNTTPFQSAGAGNYYLLDDFRNKGTASGIPTALQNDLKKRTTYPPRVICATTLNTNLTLSLQAPRDTDTLDLGFHYDPIDWAFGWVLATNATITINPGTVIAAFGTNTARYGLAIGQNAALQSQGAPNNPNWIVHYNTVQEQATNGWVQATNGLVLSEFQGLVPTAAINCRFTDWSALSVDVPLFNAPTNRGPFNFRDCEFHGGQLLSAGPTLNLTNCLLEEVSADIQPKDGLTSQLRNCLIYGATFGFGPTNSVIADNLFDQAAIPNWIGGRGNTYSGGFNAYVTNCNRLYATNATDKILAAAPIYQAGPFGSYYQTNQTNSVLFNSGDTNADLLGLYQYTVITNLAGSTQIRETNSIVDIGYHYVAADSSGNPIDSDSDGCPNYLEDPAGTGAPFLFPQPVSRAVVQGSNVTFTVTAHGTAPFSYQWTFGGIALAGATASSYTRTNAQTSHAGDYAVTVTNSVGSATSTNATLTVIVPPSIVVQPTNQVVPVGSTALFSVTAVGTGSLAYRWRKDGVNLQDSVRITGSGAAQLAIADASAADAGSYSLLVTNAGGQVVSSNAVLSLTNTLLGRWRFDDTNSWVGDQGQAPVVFTNLQGTVSWSSNAVLIDSTNSAQLKYRYMEANGRENINCRLGTVMFWFKPDWNSASLGYGSGPECEGRLLELGEKDSANGCWALLLDTNGAHIQLVTQTNAAGMTNVTVPIAWRSTDWHQVAVTYGPTNSSIYLDGSLAAIGQGVTNYPSAAARAVGGLNVGSDPCGNRQAAGQFEELTTYNYQLSTQEILGAYQAVVTNCRPVILSQPTNQTVVAGQGATFRVMASSPTPLRYQWRHGSTPIPQAAHWGYSVAAAQSVDAGTYYASVSNAAGGLYSSNATLTVLYLPTITNQPVGQGVCTTGSATFTVGATGTPSLSYQWYKDGVPIVGAFGASYTLNNLSRTNSGIYDVTVANSVGYARSTPVSLVVGAPPPAVFFGPLGGSSCRITLTNVQADTFVSVVNGTNFANPHAMTISAPYADRFFTRWTNCLDSTRMGINLTRLPTPIIDPAGSNYFNYPSNVTLRLGQENLTNMVAGLFLTELGRNANSTDLNTKITLAQSLRSRYQYSDEQIRSNLVNNFRSSAEYIAANGAPGQVYPVNTSCFIEYSIDRGTNWSLYTGPIPVSGSMNLRARACKAPSADKSSYYVYLASDVATASFTYIPTNWLIQCYGTDSQFMTNSTTEVITNYVYKTVPAFYQAGSAQDLLNIRFTTNSPETETNVGPALAGFGTNDFWNIYGIGADHVVSAFRTGMELRDSGTSTTQVRLWSFTGPFWPDFRLVYPSPWVDWNSYWYSLSAYLGENLWMICGSLGFGWQACSCSWAVQDNSLYNPFPLPDWYSAYGWPLPDHWQLPFWLPGFDENYRPMTNALTLQGLEGMAQDGLACCSQGEDLLHWLNYCGSASPEWGAPAHVYLTGLAPGTYLVNLFNAAKAHLNGWGVKPTEPQTTIWAGVPCSQFMVEVSAQPINQTAGSLSGSRPLTWPSSVNWTNEPLWLPKLQPRLHIVFDGAAHLAGMQVVRVTSPPVETNTVVLTNTVVVTNTTVLTNITTWPRLNQPAPSAWPGRRSVHLSWPAVNQATSYFVCRSLDASTWYLAGTTTETDFLDTGLIPGTIYYYIVVAANASGTSMFSAPAVAARTFADPPVYFATPNGFHRQPGAYVGGAGGGFWTDSGDCPFVQSDPSEPVPNLPPYLPGMQPLQLSQQSGNFTIPFVKVLAASGAWDPDGDSVTFKVREVLNGELTINGTPFHATANCNFDGQARVVWTPWETVTETGVAALVVSATDGFLCSVSNATVVIVPTPKTCLLGWGQAESGNLGNGELFMWDDLVYTNYTASFAARVIPQKVRGMDDVIMAAHAGFLGAAVKPDGSLWMWGDESWTGRFGEGQPCRGDTDEYVEQAMPFAVRMYDTNHILRDFTNVIDVSVSLNHVLTRRSDGTLWSWGYNCADFGVLGRDIPPGEGLPSDDQITKKARQITGFTNEYGQALSVVQAVAGNSSCLALCEDGSVWWWGTIQLDTEDGTDSINYYLTDSWQQETGPSRQRAFDAGPRVAQIAGDSEGVRAQLCGPMGQCGSSGTCPAWGWTREASAKKPSAATRCW